MAITSAMECLDARRGDVARLSPLFHYFQARPRRDHLSNVTLRAALDAAVYPGVCNLDLHDPPMTRGGALAPPSAEALNDAELRRLVGYDALLGRVRYFELDTGDRVEKWRSAIAAGLPIVFGFWMTNEYAAGRGVRVAPDGPTAAGHAAMAFGYNDKDESFLVHDSRGVAFGRNGAWPLGYTAVQRRVVIESWCVEAITYDT